MHARRRLDWIEVGRGIAALGVVLTHYDPWYAAGIPEPFGLNLRVLGGVGVEFFFILSGFIIVHVHGAELSRAAALPAYAWRRFVRVFPTYWLVLAVALVFNQTLQNGAYRVELTPGRLVTELFLLPGAEPMVGPGWTLRHEILFYGVFALALWRWWIGVPLFVGWTLACGAVLLVHGLPNGMAFDWAGIVFHHYNLDFLLGTLIALATARGRASAALIAAVAATAVLVALAAAGIGLHATVVALTWKAAFAAVVALAVMASQRGIAAPRFGVALGAMSYALYISHVCVGVVFQGGLKRVADWDAVWPVPRLLAAVAVALAAAWLLHRRFEVPILRRMRRVPWAGPRPEVAAQA